MFFLIFLSPFCLAQTNNDVLNKIFQEIQIDRSVWNEKVNRDTIIDVYENAIIDTQQVYKKLPDRDHLQKLIDSIKLPMSVQDSLKSIALIRLFQQKYFEEYERTRYQYEYLILLSNLFGVIYLDDLVKSKINHENILWKLKYDYVNLEQQSDSFIIKTHKLMKEQKYEELKREIASYNLLNLPVINSSISEKFNFFITQANIGIYAIKYALFKFYPANKTKILHIILEELKILDQYYVIVKSQIQTDYYLIGEKKWFDLIIGVLKQEDLPEFYTLITSKYEQFFQLISKDLMFQTIGNQLLAKDYSFFKEILQKTYDINVVRERYEAMCSTPQGREKTKDFLMKVTGDTNSANIENLYLGFTFCYDKEVESFLKSQKRKAKSKELKAYIENIISHSWEYGTKVNY